MVNKQTVDEQANRKTTTNLTSAQEFCKNFGKSMYGMSLTLITLKYPRHDGCRDRGRSRSEIKSIDRFWKPCYKSIAKASIAESAHYG